MEPPTTAPGGSSAQPGIRLCVLGHLRAFRDGTELEVGSPKNRAVLAALAMAEHQPLDADALASVVWPEDRIPANPAASLHVYVSGLRRALEPPRAPRARPQVLVTSGGGYALERGQVDIDAVGVATVAARARRSLGEAVDMVVPRSRLAPGALEELLDGIEGALGQWAGEPYQDLVPTLRVVAARARLEGIRSTLLADRAVAQLALGRHSEAAGQLGGLVVERPLEERLWSLYALALARSGRQADALDALRTVRRHLADELGVDPGPALRELEGMVLRQDPELHHPVADLDAPAATSTAAGEPAAGTTATRRPRAGSRPESVAMVGREEQLESLVRLLDEKGPRLAQVVGEAGIGKSTLVARLLEEARERGHLVTVGACPEDEGTPPLWPWTGVLSGLVAEYVDTDVLPSVVRALLDGGAGSRSQTETREDAEVARFRLFEAIEQVLAGIASSRPCVVLLEDLHWADSSTARLVAHLASAWSTGRGSGDLLLVVTRRPDSGHGTGLGAALDSLARHAAVRLDLSGLEVDQVAELARSRADWGSAHETAATLHARTGGNPFLLVELLRLGERAYRAGDVPAGVGDVLRKRLAAMPDRTRALLATASVVGTEFDLDVVAAASTAEPDEAPSPLAPRGGGDAVDAVLDDLDPAVAAGLVIDHGGDRMSFAHALTRDAVYAGITPTRRSRQHARVAQALEERPSSRSADRAVETARHWLAAGPRHAARAWRTAREAGQVSELRFAPDEAADLMDAASSAQREDEAASPAERLELATAAAAALLRAGRWVRFLERVDEASTVAKASGDVEAVARLAVMPAEAGPWTPRAYGQVDPAAVRNLRRVLEALPADDSGLRCRVMLALGSELYYSSGSAQEREALVDEGLAMARRLKDPVLLGRVSQRAALVIWRGGNAEARLTLADEAVGAADLADDIELLQTSLELRMSAALEAGHIERMLADVERAAGLLEQRPTIYHTVVLACLVVPWLAAQGRYDEAQSHFDRAQRLAGTSQLPWADLALGSARLGLAVWRGDFHDPDDDQHEALETALSRSEPPWPGVRLLVHLRTGDVAEVRAFLHEHGSSLVSDDFMALFLRALVAEASYLIGDRELAAQTYAALAPEAGHVASAGTGIALGPVDAYLALAAAAAGDLAAATRHADDAMRLNEAWELDACAAWLQAHRDRAGW